MPGRGCAPAGPASSPTTSVPALHPSSELPQNLSKNALSSLSAQPAPASLLEGMPEKQWAFLALKPTCPSLDSWVQTIKLKTEGWTSVRIQGDV